MPPIRVPARPLSKMPRQYEPGAILNRYCTGTMLTTTLGSKTKANCVHREGG